MHKNLQAIILAGGISEKLKIEKTKLVKKICGKEIIMYPVQLLKNLNLNSTIIAGSEKKDIQTILRQYNIEDISIIHKNRILGTGHAASMSRSIWEKENILLLGADIPLLTEDIISKLYIQHIESNADLSFISSHSFDSENKNMCRIVVTNNKIQIQNDSKSEDNQCIISGGVYIAKKSFLEKYIDQLTENFSNGKYNLSELIQIASENDCTVTTAAAPIDNIRCVDTMPDLWAIEHIKRSQIIRKWMNRGVRIANALNVMIDESVTIEPDVFIGFGVHLLGETIIKRDVSIDPFCYIKDSVIGEKSKIKPHAVITHSTIQNRTIIQPLTFINNEKQIEEQKSIFQSAIKTNRVEHI